MHLVLQVLGFPLIGGLLHWTAVLLIGTTLIASSGLARNALLPFSTEDAFPAWLAVVGGASALLWLMIAPFTVAKKLTQQLQLSRADGWIVFRICDTIYWTLRLTTFVSLLETKDPIAIAVGWSIEFLIAFLLVGLAMAAVGVTCSGYAVYAITCRPRADPTIAG